MGKYGWLKVEIAFIVRITTIYKNIEFWSRKLIEAYYNSLVPAKSITGLNVVTLLGESSACANCCN